MAHTRKQAIPFPFSEAKHFKQNFSCFATCMMPREAAASFAQRSGDSSLIRHENGNTIHAMDPTRFYNGTNRIFT